MVDNIKTRIDELTKETANIQQQLQQANAYIQELTALLLRKQGALEELTYILKNVSKSEVNQNSTPTA